MLKPTNIIGHLIMVNSEEFQIRGYFFNVLYTFTPLMAVKYGGSSTLTARKGVRKSFTKE